MKKITRTKKQVGRPPNPYSIRLKKQSLSLERKTVSWLLPPYSNFLGGRGNSVSDAARDIFQFLEEAEVPLVRRYIEALFVHEYGFKPNTVTDALKLLRKEEYRREGIVHTKVSLGDRTRTHIYTYGREPLPREIEALRKLTRLRLELDKTLKEAGQNFVRSALIASSKFEDIPRKKDKFGNPKPGNITDKEGKNRLDLMATEKSTGTRYGIEVKNIRPWLSTQKKHLEQARDLAKAHDLKPWLVVPFALLSAIKMCQEMGIHLTVLCYRVAPKMIEIPAGLLDRKARQMRTETLIERHLFPIIGPEPWKYLGAQRWTPSPEWKNPFE